MLSHKAATKKFKSEERGGRSGAIGRTRDVCARPAPLFTYDDPNFQATGCASIAKDQSTYKPPIRMHSGALFSLMQVRDVESFPDERLRPSLRCMRKYRKLKLGSAWIFPAHPRKTTLTFVSSRHFQQSRERPHRPQSAFHDVSLLPAARGEGGAKRQMRGAFRDAQKNVAVDLCRQRDPRSDAHRMVYCIGCCLGAPFVESVRGR